MSGALPPPGRVAQAMPGNYQTALPMPMELPFQRWVQQNAVPYDPSPTSDYDMRGFYAALQAGDPRATSAISPIDGRLHFPDTWKTPYHASFSNESQWATPLAPQWTAQAPWQDDSQQVSPDRKTIVFDERKR